MKEKDTRQRVLFCVKVPESLRLGCGPSGPPVHIVGAIRESPLWIKKPKGQPKLPFWFERKLQMGD